ncbi:MAG: histidine--tRNA ligase [Pyrinomonadaceae bacterium]
MSNTNPARGMRDFLPEQVRKREYVIGIIKEVYEKYGFEPLETPAVENLSTLTNKYGEEGDQLMFKILERGEKLRRKLEGGGVKSENDLSDLALRYDLTVPLARVVANYKNELPRFFKRYQIQPVWRADRPARGRYREFYQCDVDAIGSRSMIVEAELCAAVSEILERLGFDDFVILINHREILRGFLEVAGVDEKKHSDTLIALDKFDKIGEQGVSKELVERGVFTEEGGNNFIRQFLELMKLHGDPAYNIPEKKTAEFKKKRTEEENLTVIEKLREFIGKNESGKRGIESVEQILALTRNSPAYGQVKVQPYLARGLSYYTGAIFEIGLDRGDFSGSIAGGGRYDGLIGMFGKEEIPAVGLSLGLERILLIMEERGMFPEEIDKRVAADVLVTVWNEDTAAESLKFAGELRAEGLRVTVYPENDKLGKQFKYADQTGVPFVCVLGDDEIRENTVTLKNMKTGEQESVARDEIAGKIKA